MNALIMPSFNKENSFEIVSDICLKLNEIGIHIMADNKHSNRLPMFNIEFGVYRELLKKCDFIVAIGGDGTIIHASKHAISVDKPVVGINVGRLGFLACIEPNRIDVLENLVTGNYTIKKQMMLKVDVEKNGVVESFYALNDAVISRGAFPRIIDLDLYCDNKYVSHYRADGVIISTPIGSTAYNLSAGGPIVDPELESIIVTAICPHALGSMPFVFRHNKLLEISSKQSVEDEICLTVDGESNILIDKNVVIKIYKADLYAKFVAFNEREFYEIINEKLVGKIL